MSTTTQEQQPPKPEVKDKTRELVLAKGTAKNGKPTVTIYESEYNELKIISGNMGVDYQAINEAFDQIHGHTSQLTSMIFNIKRSMLLAIQGYSVTPQGAIIPLKPIGQMMTEEEVAKETVTTEATAVNTTPEKQAAPPAPVTGDTKSNASPPTNQKTTATAAPEKQV